MKKCDFTGKKTDEQHVGVQLKSGQTICLSETAISTFVQMILAKRANKEDSIVAKIGKKDD